VSGTFGREPQRDGRRREPVGPAKAPPAKAPPAKDGPAAGAGATPAAKAAPAPAPAPGAAAAAAPAAGPASDPGPGPAAGPPAGAEAAAPPDVVEGNIPVRLSPEERRDLAKRLAERLGTRAASSVGVFVEEVEKGPDGRRVALRSETGTVRIAGEQEVRGKAGVVDGALYRLLQRDAIDIGGLEGGVSVRLVVDTAVDLPARPEPDPTEDAAAKHPFPVKVEVRGGDAALREAARDEAFRLAGERFAAGLLKGGSRVVEIPGGPAIGAPELARWLRGPWRALDALLPAGVALGRFAQVEDPGKSGQVLVVREAFAPPDDLRPVPTGGRALLVSARAVAPVLALPAKAAGLLAAARHEREGTPTRAMDKALTTFAYELSGQTPAEPRPLPRPFDVFLADAQTPARRLVAPRRLKGEVREAASGGGARLIAVEADVFEEGKDKPVARLVERHLIGLPDGAVALLSALDRDLVVAVLAPADHARKWLERLRRALP